MIGQSGRGSCRAWVGVVSTLLLWLVAPSSAEAGCGDHVHFSEKDLLVHSMNHPIEPWLPPCRGANCSQRETDPLPTPASPPPTNPNDNAGLLPVSTFSTDDRSDWLAISDLLYDYFVSCSIFHPPRCTI